MMVLARQRSEASATGCYRLHVRFESHICSGQMRFRQGDDTADVWLGERLAFLNESKCSDSNESLVQRYNERGRNICSQTCQ
jgi:hypothetical protein